jgi:multidrug resistance efflux pump
MFLSAVVASGWLWQRSGGTVQAIGEVDAPRVDVTSPTTGQIVELPHKTRGQWLVYDQVQAGDVIARIENPQLEPGKFVEIQAPISGTLVALHSWPGQSVIPGGLIATIAADHGRHIVGYIPEGTSLTAWPGMPVTVRSRAVGTRPVVTEVEQVAQQIEQLPRHQWAGSATPQWGTPVRIKMPNDVSLPPGALVDVLFSRSDMP